MQQKTKGLIWAALTATALVVAGCGESNLFGSSSSGSGSSAKTEKGVAALNDGDWDKAIAIFKSLYDSNHSPENAKYLASAYVGKSGFDMLSLVSRIADNQENGGSESIIYDSVTAIFDDDGDGKILAAELDEKIALLEQALEVLVPGYSAAPGKAPAARVLARDSTDEELFQAGNYAAIHAVLSIVSQLHDPVTEGELLLTLDELQTALQSHPDLIDSVVVPDTFNEDLALVAEASDVLIAGLAGDADTNKIADEFDKFLSDIGYSGNSNVTDQELRDYLHFLLETFGGGS